MCHVFQFACHLVLTSTLVLLFTRFRMPLLLTSLMLGVQGTHEFW